MKKLTLLLLVFFFLPQIAGAGHYGQYYNQPTSVEVVVRNMAKGYEVFCVDFTESPEAVENGRFRIEKLLLSADTLRTKIAQARANGREKKVRRRTHRLNKLLIEIKRLENARSPGTSVPYSASCTLTLRHGTYSIRFLDKEVFVFREGERTPVCSMLYRSNIPYHGRNIVFVTDDNVCDEWLR